MSMADMWLTPAAQEEFSQLQATAPDQANAVSDAINEIPAANPGHLINLPGAPVGAPFHAMVPRHPDAPVVIYRHMITGEAGRWLVVSLMNRDDYHGARRAEQILAGAPPAVREFVNAVVEGTVATVTVAAPPGTVTTTPPQTGGAASTTGIGTSSPAR